MKINSVSTTEWLFSEIDKHIKNVIKSSSNKKQRIIKIKNIFKK